MRRATLFPAAATLALAVLAAACGGGVDPAAEKASISSAYARFFDEKTPVDQKVALLEGGASYRALIEESIRSGQSRDISVEVRSVTLAKDNKSAEVTFAILLGGSPVLPNAPGKAVKEGETWKVSESTFCALIQLGGGTCTPAATGQ